MKKEPAGKNKDYVILQKESPLLRKKAGLIPVEEITSPKIRNIIEKMKKALAGEIDGVAIAGPQIGASLQIFVVSPRGSSKNPDSDKKVSGKPLIFINPRITKQSKKSPWLLEGCLSVRWLYGKVRRSEKVTIQAYDEKGQKISRGASGLLAQIFQHEIDHLNGILFIDKAKEIDEVPPEEIKEV